VDVEAVQQVNEDLARVAWVELAITSSRNLSMQ